MKIVSKMACCKKNYTVIAMNTIKNLTPTDDNYFRIFLYFPREVERVKLTNPWGASKTNKKSGEHWLTWTSIV